jgi:hypothetical protein
MLDPCVRCMCVCVCVCVCCISDVSVYLDVYDVYRIYESDVSAYRYLSVDVYDVYRIYESDVSAYRYLSVSVVPTDIYLSCHRHSYITSVST